MHKTVHLNFWNPYDKTNNYILTLFSDKSEHVSIFDSRGTFLEHLGNVTMCGIMAYQNNVLYAVIKLSAESPIVTFCAMDVLSLADQ